MSDRNYRDYNGYQQSGYQNSGYQNNGYYGGVENYPPYQSDSFQQGNGGYPPYQQGSNYQNSYQNGYPGGNQYGYQNMPMNQGAFGAQTGAQGHQTVSLAEYSRRVYGWMAGGVSLTFILGFILMHLVNESNFDSFIAVFAGAAIVEVAMAIILSFFIYKMNSVVSKTMFLIFSLCNGITIAPTLMLCGVQSAFYAFAATAMLFITMSVYGMITKRDLTKIGPILIIGLFMLLGYSIIGYLFHMPMTDLFTGIIGIVLFTIFTAVDANKIKKGYSYFSSNPEMLARSSINIALQLYLDFINLFLYLIRIFADSRN